MLLSVFAMAMAMTTSAQTHQDAAGMMTKNQIIQCTGNNTNRAMAKTSIDEKLGCPEGTVFGGEHKESMGGWTGYSNADEGRAEIGTCFYQHFTDCYYKFHGVRFLGMFNYYNAEEMRWIYCSDRGGINDKGEMTKPVKFRVGFYKDNGEDGLPGDMVYSKEFDLVGEKTGVKIGNELEGITDVYAFTTDLGEEICMEHGYMQICAVNVEGEPVDCFFSLFTTSTSPGHSMVSMDFHDGDKPQWMQQMSCVYCFDGNGSFIADKAVKFNRILSPGVVEKSKFGKVQVELTNIGASDIDNVELQLWQDNKLIATEKVQATIKSLDTYKYTFNARIDCSEQGKHNIVIKNVTPNSEFIAEDNISIEVENSNEITYANSKSQTSRSFITRVQVGDITNETAASKYTDYSYMTTVIYPGQQLSLEVGAKDDKSFIGAWVDWNSNGKFDETEAVTFKDGKGIIEIPASADIQPGEKRLRIVLSIDKPKPEGTYFCGETEDYTIVVKNTPGTPTVGMGAEDVIMEANGDKQSVGLDITNNGKGTLSADVNFSYILPNAPTSNYSMKKSNVPNELKNRIVRKTTAKASDNNNTDEATQYVLRYDNGQYDIIGITNAPTAVYATYYPGQMLSSLKGMKVSSIDIYVANPARENSIVIYGEKDQNNSGDIITEQAFTPQSNAWNHIVLDNPVTIGDKDLWIGYKVKGIKNDGFCIGIDNGDGIIGFGDMVYVNDYWWSMVDLGMNNNYCIRTNVTGERTAAINWLSVDKKHINVEGGKSEKLTVSADASKLNASTLYEAKIEIKSNDELRSTIYLPVYIVNGKATGIIAKENTGGANVRFSGNELSISSEKTIDNIQIFDMAGKLANRIKVGGTVVNTTVGGVNGSLYILNVNYADGSKSTIKIPVIR